MNRFTRFGEIEVCLIRLYLLIFLLVVIYGLICPLLISADDTGAVIVGAVIAIGIPILIPKFGFLFVRPIKQGVRQ